MGQEESRSEEMDLAQIQELCILFMKECPSGALHLHEFKRIFGVPSSSAEESLYMETIFRSFDTNNVRSSRLHALGSRLWALGSGLLAAGSWLGWLVGTALPSLMYFNCILDFACRTTHWTSWSTLPHCISSCGGTWRTDSSGPSRCTTRTGTGSWTAMRSSGSSRSDPPWLTQGTEHTSPLSATELLPGIVFTYLMGLAPAGVMSYLSASGSISGLGLTRIYPNWHLAHLHSYF